MSEPISKAIVAAGASESDPETRVPRWVRKLSPQGLFGLVEGIPESDARVYPIRVLIPIYCGLAHALFVVVFLAFAQPLLAFINLASTLFYGVQLLLLRRGRQTAGLMLGWSEIGAHAPLLTVLLGTEAGYLFYYFGMPALVFMVYRAGERLPRTASVVYSLISVPVLLVTMRWMDPIIALDAWQLGVLFYLNAVLSVMVLLFVAAYFVRLTDRAEARIVSERERSERLLANALPAAIADRLKREPGNLADQFESATILFADLVGFTELSSRIAAREVVELLNEIISDFDRLAERHRLTKIKTIGDAYMVAGGVPVACEGHASAVADLALDMQRAVRDWAARKERKLDIRIGIHSGPVVAGVVGVKRFVYDLWGETVNHAAIIESRGEPGRIHVSEATRELLDSRFELEGVSTIELGGGREIRTFFLTGRRSEWLADIPEKGAS